MNNTMRSLKAIQLVGISIRTSNGNESDPQTAKIGMTVGKFFGGGLSAQIQHRSQPGRVFCVYTAYASDETGDYTYFIGEAVEDLAQQPDDLETMVIPAQDYAVITSASGKMPEVVINLWQSVWQMSAKDLGGQRSYLADFEIYDERSHDPNAAVIDAYIGIKR